MLQYQHHQIHHVHWADKDFLWIVEVAPGIAAASDVTETFVGLGNYWPSYNCPFTKSVYVATGFQRAYATYGDTYSYTNCSRANMFARDQANIHSYADFQHELRFNEWSTDPYSKNDPYNSIAARADLRSSTTSPSTAKASGAIDAKTTSYKNVMGGLGGVADAVNGPTFDNVDTPVFRWSGSAFENQTHLGQPDVFNFNFVHMDFYLH